MSILLANTPLTSADGLSEAARRALALIDGGTQWLDGAMRDGSPQHRFADEPSLIAGVQAGVEQSKRTQAPPAGTGA